MAGISVRLVKELVQFMNKPKVKKIFYYVLGFKSPGSLNTWYFETFYAFKFDFYFEHFALIDNIYVVMVNNKVTWYCTFSCPATQTYNFTIQNCIQNIKFHLKNFENEENLVQPLPAFNRIVIAQNIIVSVNYTLYNIVET